MRTRLSQAFALIAVIGVSGCGAHTAPAVSAGPPRALAGRIYGDAATGRMVMERWCISCHKTTGPLTDQPAPQLSALAADAERSARTIRSFLMHPHSPMPPLELSNQMIEDIIAYLRQVKAQQG